MNNKNNTVFVVIIISCVLVVLFALGAFLYLTNAFGETKIEVPDVVDMKLSKAQNILEDNDLDVNITYEENEDGDSDLVISQSPEAGEKVEKNKVINLIVTKKVSRNKETETKAASTKKIITIPTEKEPEFIHTMYVCNIDETSSDNWLALKSAPDLSSERIAKMFSGESVLVTNESPQNGFYHVKYKNLTGYASEKYLSNNKPSSDSQYYLLRVRGTRVTPEDPFLSVRSTPDGDSSEIDRIYDGDIVSTDGKITNGFYHIYLENGKVGYGYSKYLEKVE